MTGRKKWWCVLNLGLTKKKKKKTKYQIIPDWKLHTAQWKTNQNATRDSGRQCFHTPNTV